MHETDKEILFINDLASLLEMRVPTIRQNVLNHRFHIVPPPIKLGRRYAWHSQTVRRWIAERFGLEPEEETTPTPPKEEEEKRGRGRPRMPI